MVPTHRLIALITIAAIAVLYRNPVSRYLRTSRAVVAISRDVKRLQLRNAKLSRAIEQAGTGHTLLAEARKLGLIRPGEQLFIVQGIEAWRRTHHD
jgi:hypothetical protein